MRKTIETYRLNNNTDANRFGGPGWRLVHNGTDVIKDIFFTSGITKTINQMQVFDTSGETLTEIIVLGLNYTPTSDIENNVDEYLSDI